MKLGIYRVCHSQKIDTIIFFLFIGELDTSHVEIKKKLRHER